MSKHEKRRGRKDRRPIVEGVSPTYDGLDSAGCGEIVNDGIGCIYPDAPRLSRCAGDLMCLDAAQKCLLRELCEYAEIDECSRCRPSIARLAIRLRHSENWVRTQSKKLQEAGLISIIQNRSGGAPGQTPVYEVNERLLRRLSLLGRIELQEQLVRHRMKKASDSANRFRRICASGSDAEMVLEPMDAEPIADPDNSYHLDAELVEFELPGVFWFDVQIEMEV